MNEAIDTVDTVETVETAVESGFDESGGISDENMAAALTGGAIEESVEVVTEEPVEESIEVVTEEPVEESTKEPEGVMSKSGESIIPYADLIKEREGRHAERDRANDLQNQLDALSVKQKDDNSESEEKSSGLKELEAMFEDYPEAEGILKGLTTANTDMAKQLGELRDQIGRVAETSAASMHFKAINDAHAGAETILTSDGFEAWLSEMAPISQEAYRSVFKQGTSDQVISMLNDFATTQKKSEISISDPPDSKVIEKKVAKAEADAKKKQSPGSLSDISGSANPHDEKTAVIDMSQANFMDKMSTLSSAAQLELLDKIM